MKLFSKDKVAFVAPSGEISGRNLENALHWFEKQGLSVELMPHLFDRDKYMAGTDQARAKDLNTCFERDDIKAIFCVRGGAGSGRILDLINYEAVAKNPKPVFGLSDSTALQNALYQKSGLVSYTGFLPLYDFKYSVLDPKIEASLKDIFQEKSFKATGGQTLVGGSCSGTLVGGCLSVFCQLCGTSYFPDLKDKILLIEDVGEKTYRLDLMLNQLRQQACFDQIKGLVFGQFLNCPEADAGDGTPEEIIQEFAQKVNVPTVYRFAYGHESSRYVLPIGGKVTLNADEGSIFVY